MSNSLQYIVYLSGNFSIWIRSAVLLSFKATVGPKLSAQAPFPEMEEDKRNHLLGIKPSNKDLTVAERRNSFLPVPVGLNWFSLAFVRFVRNVWIRSFGAVPRTGFM